MACQEESSIETAEDLRDRLINSYINSNLPVSFT